MEHFSTKDLLYDNSCYNTSFFQIFLKADYDPDLSKMSKKDLGTFVHEYVHYLQNISTPWGLYSSLIRYKAVSLIVRQLIEAEEILLPFSPSFDEKLQQEIDIMMLGEGTCVFNEYYKKQIDTANGIQIIPESVNINGYKIDKIAVRFHFTTGEECKIFLGAKIIKESMASLYQCLFDSNALSVHDVPYNLIRLLFEQYAPNIAHDIKKIITICHLSLYSMRPVEILLDRMDFANRHAEISCMELVDEFINNHPVKTAKGVMQLDLFFDEMIDSFKKILKDMTMTNIPYLDRVFENVKLKNGYLPILNILYGHNDSMGVQHLQPLIEYMGIPYLTTDRGQTSWGILKENEALSEMSPDIAALRSITLIVDYLTIRRRDTYCLAYKQECDGSIKDDFECLSDPWQGNECIFTTLLKFFDIDRRKIKGWKTF